MLLMELTACSSHSGVFFAEIGKQGSPKSQGVTLLNTWDDTWAKWGRNVYLVVFFSFLPFFKFEHMAFMGFHLMILGGRVPTRWDPVWVGKYNQSLRQDCGEISNLAEPISFMVPQACWIFLLPACQLVRDKSRGHLLSVNTNHCARSIFKKAVLDCMPP